MKSTHLHLAAMLFFVVGFVGASSGWAPLIARMVQGRPSWSLCGQEMCSCLPTAPIADTEPDCPLCATTDEPASPRTALADNPKRLPRTENFDALSDASQAGCSSLFLSFLFGVRSGALAAASDRGAIALDQHTPPRSALRDLPTPPPRA